jgi:serine-type D-Ala-D-Ala carboxypeptidase (penicillin-binding protein 5/6)
VESFVELMNQRANKMGLKDSHFVNTNGLPVAKHYSCAYDIGMISRELMKFENAREWFTAWQEDIKVGLPGKESKFTLTNTNKLIRNYSGAIGVKTGFTQDAGYCLSGAAERDSTRLIAVVLGCETSKIRFAEMAKLLDYGFANYQTVQFAEKGEKIKDVSVSKGDEVKFSAVAEDDLGITVKKGSKDNIKKKIEIYDDLKLPIEKGGKVGSMIIYNGEEKEAEYDLVSDREIKRADFMTTYIRMIKKLI